ncbi:hypothetical protein CYMTET_23716 [Cymbomonas tetramitiformis]|uniref:Uncharacterized protein n=1 Tax=Cymbomonas tetramitiformis TaxID=36881 RepID=A0AAE0FXJ2_9CHLO|nr:hypothetical protein CYMTET_23716 [Cymbomonas tetramitiformis]
MNIGIWYSCDDNDDGARQETLERYHEHLIMVMVQTFKQNEASNVEREAKRRKLAEEEDREAERLAEDNAAVSEVLDLIERSIMGYISHNSAPGLPVHNWLIGHHLGAGVRKESCASGVFFASCEHLIASFTVSFDVEKVVLSKS